MHLQNWGVDLYLQVFIFPFVLSLNPNGYRIYQSGSLNKSCKLYCVWGQELCFLVKAHHKLLELLLWYRKLLLRKNYSRYESKIRLCRKT
jgi:hypothetical protein